MIEVQIHRAYGHDESFEVLTQDEVDAIVAEAQRDPDTRRIVVLDESGRMLEDL